MHYADATVIKTEARIRKERLLPQKGDVNVRIGQEVTAVQVVARAVIGHEFFAVPVAEPLGLDPEILPDLLLVNIGDMVNSETVLAEKKRPLGRKQVVAPGDGMVFAVVNGRVYLQQTSEVIELRANLAGRIVNTIANRGVVIETTGAIIHAHWSAGREGHGPLITVVDSPLAPLTAEHLDYDVAGKIVVAGHLDQPELLQAADEAGVRGLIVGSMPASICTQAANLPFPIVLTEQIGQTGMNGLTYQTLAKFSGAETSLFTDVDEQLGNRPEIIIPQPSTPATEAVRIHVEINPGDTVRICRAPYAGQLGLVTRVYKKAHANEIGITAHGADIRLADDNVVFIPLANLEQIVGGNNE